LVQNQLRAHATQYLQTMKCQNIRQWEMRNICCELKKERRDIFILNFDKKKHFVVKQCMQWPFFQANQDIFAATHDSDFLKLNKGTRQTTFDL
jgi:hypothetical protein